VRGIAGERDDAKGAAAPDQSALGGPLLDLGLGGVRVDLQARVAEGTVAENSAPQLLDDHQAVAPRTRDHRRGSWAGT